MRADVSAGAPREKSGSLSRCTDESPIYSTRANLEPIVCSSYHCEAKEKILFRTRFAYMVSTKFQHVAYVTIVLIHAVLTRESYLPSNGRGQTACM